MNKKYFLFSLLLLSAGLCLLGSCSDDDETRGVWYRRSDLDGPARCYASAFTIGDQGYLCCGMRESTKSYLKDLWCYDIYGDYWTQCADMPDNASVRHSAASFALDGKGYVTTGAIKDEPKYLADTWEYNPQTNTWTQKDDFAGGIRYGALGFAIKGYGYVGTGRDSDNYLKDFYRFDPSAPSGSQWTVVNGFGGFKRYYGTSFVINDEAYILCGLQGSNCPEDFYKFDGNTFTRLRDIADTNDDEDYDDDYAITRYSTVAFVIDGTAYIATGNRGGASTDYWKYIPATDLWYGDDDDDFTPLSKADYGGTARYGAVAFSNGSRAFVLTGTSGSNSYMDDVYELKPDEWYED
ncbi:MAG: Kelch repeat-containing protein [Bacteroides sp.]